MPLTHTIHTLTTYETPHTCTHTHYTHTHARTHPNHIQDTTQTHTHTIHTHAHTHTPPPLPRHQAQRNERDERAAGRSGRAGTRTSAELQGSVFSDPNSDVLLRYMNEGPNGVDSCSVLCNKLPQTYHLKTVQTYCPAVVMAQASRFGFARSSARVLTG